jgi:anthranilate synthase/phosphoribosyltransferase
MGIRHREFTLEGVQFHPESIASEDGKTLLKNFIHYRREPFVATEQLQKVIAGDNMSANEAEAFMTELTEGNLSDAQIAGFLTALSTKGIVAEEIAGCARVLQQKRVPVKSDRPLLDTCGTGGDGLGTFNISSMSAIIAASCGAVVAKHGNRAVSSKSGSADFYRALGFEIDITPAQSEELLRKNDFAFLFAPLYHGAMKYAAPARKALKVKTIMNLLGPLANPAGAEYQIIGVYSAELAPVIAEAARMLGVKRGMIVHGRDGEDELSVCDTSLVVEFDEEKGIRQYEFDPFESCGITRHSVGELLGGDAKTNAELARQILGGQGIEAIRDAVCLNAGAALYIYGMAEDIAEGYALCLRVIKIWKGSTENRGNNIPFTSAG